MSLWSKRGGNTTARRKLVALVVARDEGVCHLCGYGGATTVDHVIPRSQGGTDDARNLRAAHATCNSARGDRAPQRPTPTRRW